MTRTNAQLRRVLVEACRILDQERLVHGYGHASARAEDGGSVLITPRKGLRSVRSPQEILLMNLEGKRIGKPIQNKKLQKDLQLPLEVFLHTEIYRARPEVNAICRTHGKFALVLSVLRRTLRPVHELAVPVGAEVPLFDSPELISSLEVGRRMVSALGSARGLLLRGNGGLTVGKTVEEAVVNAILMETSAEIQWRALVIGEPAWIAGDEYRGEFAKLAKREYEAVLRPWRYYLDRSRKRRSD